MRMSSDTLTQKQTMVEVEADDLHSSKPFSLDGLLGSSMLLSAGNNAYEDTVNGHLAFSRLKSDIPLQNVNYITDRM